MGQTNVSFEISALIILVIVFIHMNMKKQVRSFTNRFFTLFTFCGVIDVLLDVLTEVMLERTDIFSITCTTIWLEIFYVFQLLMPYLLYLYVLSLRNALNKKGRIQMVISTGITVVMAVLALTNMQTGIYFRFTEPGVRELGPCYYGLFGYALVYLLASLIDVIVNRRQMAQRYYFVVGEFVFISSISVVIQFLIPHVLLTGAGIAISIIILMLTVQNPNNVQDRLTGVFSVEGMQETLVEYHINKRSYGLIIVAIDNLKRINYIFGMDYGDVLLQNVADELKQIAGFENVFRFIGDRFVMVLAEEEEYQKAYEKVVAYFKKPLNIRGMEVSITACICAIPISDSRGSISDVSSFMDFSVECAKKMENGTVLLVDDNMAEKYHRRRIIESYLEIAIEKDLFEIHYQPIYSLAEKRFTCMEALVRLTHPQLGPISPAEFIPIAEKSGVVSKIDHLAFRKVCGFISAHKEILNVMSNVKFNISPADLMDVKLGERMEDDMKYFDLNPSIFQFEITETTATLYFEHVKQWADRLRRLGVELCLDDFGAGYANLDAVMVFPYGVIKIDRSVLLTGMASKKGADLYEGIVILLRMLGFAIVAEGAETKEQIEFLHKLQVDYIQGYYYSRPITEEAVLELVHQEA